MYQNDTLLRCYVFEKDWRKLKFLALERLKNRGVKKQVENNVESDRIFFNID